MFRRNLVHQPLANSRVGLPVVRRIGESLVSVGDERQRVGQLTVVDPERRPGFAQQAIGRKRGRSRGLGEKSDHGGREQKHEVDLDLHG